MKKILLTGGAGFLGSNLAHDLLKKGNHVVVVDDLSTGQKRNIDELCLNEMLTFEQMGVETEEFRTQFIDNAEYMFDEVYHLACHTGVPNIERLGEEMLETCSVGTKNVLQVATKHNARFVFTSSSEIYGEPLMFPQSEEYSGNVDPQGWRASYEEGKRFSESLVALYVKKYNLHAITFRLFNVYGPRMNPAETRVIPRFLSQALRGEPLTVHGAGDQKRTMCYVSDLVRGLQLAMENGKRGDIYNIGSDEEISMLDLARKVIELTQSKSLIVNIERASHDHSRRLPVLDRIWNLGWKQSVSLDDGILATLEHFRSFPQFATLSETSESPSLAKETALA